MQRINYFAVVLIVPTLLYVALVVLNPFNYFGDGDGERLFAIAYIAAAYPGKAAAIQLIGTTIIAFGIIISQENLIVRTASLAGTTFVWIGLIQGMAGNSLLVNTTLLVFLVLTPTQALFIGIIILMPTILRLTMSGITALIGLANDVRQWTAYRVRLIGNRIGMWLRSVLQTTRRLWPF